MATACCERQSPRYRGLFPDWTGQQPLSYYFLENLLEARRDSFFPTNGAGPDEDVNVYLAHLLTRLVSGEADPRVLPGADPVLRPAGAGAPRSWSAASYRLNADHRLFFQGIFHQGEMRRRRGVCFGRTEEETRARDRGVAVACYEMAADLLDRGPAPAAGLVGVLRKLAAHYDDYVHVLGVLATRRLGLGARLTTDDLVDLTGSNDAPTGPAAKTDLDPAALAAPDMDWMLDRLLEYRATRDPLAKERLLAAATALGVDPARLSALEACD